MGLTLMNIPTTKANPTYEDFINDYTEVDIPTDRINVDSTTKVTVTDGDMDETFYLYCDKGVDFFDGDFIHVIDAQIGTTTVTNAQYAIWALQNQLSGYRPCADSLHVIVLYQSGNYFFVLYERNNNNQYGATAISVSVDVTYFLKMKRDEAVGSFGTLYLGIYTTSVLRDNGDATDGDVGNALLTLHAKNDFQYIMAVSSFDLALSGYAISAFSENLDLNPILLSVTFYFNEGGILRVNNATMVNGTNRFYGNGTFLELASLPLNSTYVFSSFTWDNSNATTNPYNLTITENLTVWCYFSVPEGYGGFVFLFFGLLVGLVIGALVGFSSKR